MSRRYHNAELPSRGQQLELPKDRSHHLLEVCRHPRGEPLWLFDGAGFEQRCKLVDVRGRVAVVEGLEDATQHPAEGCATLLLSLCKPRAWETSLRMATELGVKTIQPVQARRSTVRKLRLARWERLLVSACEQCGRRWLPTLREPTSLLQALEGVRQLPTRLVLAPDAPVGPGSPTGDRALLVGPEGGLSDEELAEALEAGFVPAGLGEHVLRVDTAVAAGLTLYG